MVFLILTGGEIFVRRDFFDIYEPLTRMGLILVLFTNATRVTKDVAARLAQAPPSRMEITLYGATAKTFEAVTDAPYGYEKCCAGIEALLAQGIPLSLKTTLTRDNVAEVDSMRQMADNWGVPFAASWLLSGGPTVRGPRWRTAGCRLPSASPWKRRIGHRNRGDGGRAEGAPGRLPPRRLLLPRRAVLVHPRARTGGWASVNSSPSRGRAPWRSGSPGRGRRPSATSSPRRRRPPRAATATCLRIVFDARRGR